MVGQLMKISTRLSAGFGLLVLLYPVLGYGRSRPVAGQGGNERRRRREDEALCTGGGYAERRTRYGDCCAQPGPVIRSGTDAARMAAPDCPA